MTALLESNKRFRDEASDALLCPGRNKEEWNENMDEIRAMLFLIQETKSTQLCVALAEKLLKNIAQHEAY